MMIIKTNCMINVSTIQLFYYYKLCKLVVQGYFSNLWQINMYVIVLMVNQYGTNEV